MVTMFYSVFDFEKNTISFTSAGHPFTYHIDADGRELSSLESISYPLAVKRDLKFKSSDFVIQKGDYLLFYSDGIVEALDEEGEVFGYDRVEEIMLNGAYESSRELLELLITEVRIHIGTAEQFDDITAVVVRIK
jgi:sigma-B regulation protein RsbU (phosphoserine phosphatase)